MIGIFKFAFIPKNYQSGVEHNKVIAEFSIKFGPGQGLYKDRHSYGRSTMSTQHDGVFNFPISKLSKVNLPLG